MRNIIHHWKEYKLVNNFGAILVLSYQLENAHTLWPSILPLEKLWPMCIRKPEQE